MEATHDESKSGNCVPRNSAQDSDHQGEGQESNTGVPTGTSEAVVLSLGGSVIVTVPLKLLVFPEER